MDNGDAQLLDIDAINEFANPSLDMTPINAVSKSCPQLSCLLASRFRYRSAG